MDSVSPDDSLRRLMDSPIGGARDVGLREILLRHLGSWVRVNLSDMGELRRAAVVAVGRDCFTVYDSERTFVLSFTAVMAVSESVDADDVVVVISPLAVTHRSIRA